MIAATSSLRIVVAILIFVGGFVDRKRIHHLHGRWCRAPVHEDVVSHEDSVETQAKTVLPNPMHMKAAVSNKSILTAIRWQTVHSPAMYTATAPPLILSMQSIVRGPII